MKPIYKKNIAEWHELFTLCTGSLADHVRNISYVKDALVSINQIKPDLSPAMNKWFELHAHLFVLEMLLIRTPYQSIQHGAFIGYHTHAAITEVQKALEGIFDNELEIADESEYRHCVTDTLSYLRKKILTETGAKLYFSDPYFRLWKNWIHPNQKDTSLHQEELQRLEAAQDELGAALSGYTWLLARSWISFFLNRDHEARTCLTEMNSRSDLRPGDLFHILSAMSDAQEWHRLSEWLMETIPLMERHRLNSLEIFFQYWDAAIEHIPHAEQQMWEQLDRMLPYASSIYEEKLRKHGQWKQWVDYQLSTGSEPLSYRVSVFTPIEKNAPELLLPFYHQAVERHVLLKNRDGYKAAVKLLKRLAKLYKKMKNDAQWERFIEAFASRYSRLRALQEELRKGKLRP